MATRSSKRPTWTSTPVPKTGVQRLKYAKICSDHIDASLKQDKKQDPLAHIPTVNHLLPAVLYRRSWKGPPESNSICVVQLRDTMVADWGYSDTVALSCANCQQALKSGKLPRHTLVLPHYPRAFMPLCRQCTLLNTP